MRRQTESAALSEADLRPEMLMGDLTSGQQKMVEIAKGLVFGATSSSSTSRPPRSRRARSATCSRSSGRSGRRDRGHLHLAPPRRGVRDRRPRHGPPRRPQGERPRSRGSPRRRSSRTWSGAIRRPSTSANASSAARSSWRRGTSPGTACGTSRSTSVAAKSSALPVWSDRDDPNSWRCSSAALRSSTARS